MKKILAILSTLLLSLGATAQTGQVNHGGTGLNTAANNSILVGTGPNTYTLVAVPDCPDASGNHLNYTAGTYTITCGTSSTAGSGTPYQVTRYDSTGHALQDSTGSDNPANGPTRWSNGLSVEGNAGYRLFSNSPSGTSLNLLACADASVNTVTQITTCPAGTNKTFGIVDTGAGVSGNARVAMIGFHAAIFDNQTAVNDFVAPSATNPGEVSDVGGSKPNNVQIIGKVTTVNSGAGTLATVDLFTGDTVAPGSSGGSGTVSSSCAGVAYYPSSGTTIVGDCLFITDGVGHVTMYSLGLLDSTYAGFLYMKQGPLPPAAPDNTIEEFAPTSVTTYSIQKASAAGAIGEYPQVTGTTTDANGHTIDQMGWGSGGGGGGGVSNFTAGTLSPLFTTSVANPTTTPALTFSLSNAAANTIFGNFTGSSGAPSYNAIAACGDSTHALSYVASTGFSCQAISSGASSVGLSINGGSSSGIFAATGTPVTSTGTLNYNLSGTSGGIPYFSTSSILSSSAALTANNPVLGGGAGSSPISGTRSGNTTELGTVSGSVTSTHAAVWDASGNLVDGGAAPATGTACPGVTASGTYCHIAYYPNETIIGTTAKVPVKLAATTVNATLVIKTQAADTSLGWATGLIGICTAGAGTSGSCAVAISGTAVCTFDNAATQGSFVEIGATGICHANSLAGFNENPELHAFFAKVRTTIGSAGDTDVDLIPFGSYSNTDAGSSSIGGPFLLSGYGGSQFTSTSPIVLDPSGGTATAAAPFAKIYSGWRVKNGNNYSDFFIGSNGGGHDTEIDLGGTNANGAHSFRIACESCTGAAAGHYTPPDVDTNKNGTTAVDDSQADTHIWTLTGNYSPSSIGGYDTGHWSDYKMCQDGTGGRTFVATPFKGLLPTPPAAASACVQFHSLYVDNTHSYIINQRIDPVVATAQVAAISTTNLVKPQADSTWRVTATINCESASAAATVNVTIGWTDTSNTAQTTTLGSAVACAVLGASSVGDLTHTFSVKANTNITYATAIANTPTYRLVVIPENLSAN